MNIIDPITNKVLPFSYNSGEDALFSINETSHIRIGDQIKGILIYYYFKKWKFRIGTDRKEILNDDSNIKLAEEYDLQLSDEEVVKELSSAIKDCQRYENLKSFK